MQNTINGVQDRVDVVSTGMRVVSDSVGLLESTTNGVENRTSSLRITRMV